MVEATLTVPAQIEAEIMRVQALIPSKALAAVEADKLDPKKRRTKRNFANYQAVQMRQAVLAGQRAIALSDEARMAKALAMLEGFK